MHLLAAYRSETAELSFRQLDPDQNPAAFRAIQQKYGILSGTTEEGQSVTDASIVIAGGERHWFVTADDLLRIEPDGERVRPALEQALTEGIANVLARSKSTICFSRGHKEQGLYDAGPEGLTELRARLEKNNYSVEERELGGERAGVTLASCQLLVIAGPRLPFGAPEAGVVARAVEAGLSVFALLPPILGEGGRVVSSGLEPVAKLSDAELGSNLVLETDAKRRAPRGIGEVFFAAPEPHAVTRGLTRGTEAAFDVLVSETQSVRPLGAAVPLLRTSDRAVALVELGPVLDGRNDARAASGSEQSFVLAVAHQRERAGAAPVRGVWVGSAALAQNRSFREAASYGGRLFVENAVAWLSERPALVSIPEKSAHELGLALSEDSLAEILRYVMVYMPATAGLLGVFVILRRRALETRSRRKAQKPAENADAPRA
jgi:hypothetical protein